MGDEEERDETDAVGSPRGPDVGRSRRRSGTLDALFTVFASERRRALLAYLAERAGEPVPLQELVDAVAEHERPHPGPGRHRDRVEIDLRHVHLPKLGDAGVIEYDPVAATVRYDGSAPFDDLLALLDDWEA